MENAAPEKVAYITKVAEEKDKAAIEELHGLGYISCDIKFGNFAPGHRSNKQSKIIFLYDSGLSKKYADKMSKKARKELGAVCAEKKAARAIGRMQFLYETPKQFDQILTMVDSYSFESQPEHDKIYKMLEEVREEKGVCKDEHWDWEEKSTSPTASTGTSDSVSGLKRRKKICFKTF
ncbi:unnamed protein product [Angiostrongylus costaricensis]|uniref:Protein kinase domain-containing protein n=1 Tax=Angiostrongylus costaricensis TaxID=334426 RepID=A0A158PLC1_ANGCS|nr:unnamed protein product [Angiostrongylus costaricensis]